MTSPSPAWRLAPVEPTREMTAAGYRVSDVGQPGYMAEIWSAAFSAAPSPPEELREQVARAIDPHEWALWDLGQAKRPPVENWLVRDSLAKADAVLALLQGRAE